MQIPLLNQFPQLPSFQQPTQQAPQEKLSKAEAREVKGFCPLCKCELWYDPSQTPVLCNVCDCEVVPVSSIGDRGFSDSEVGEGGGASVGFSAMGAAPIMGFDNPESALIYLENFFENYDWEEYYITSEIAIPEISKTIEANKVKNGASAQSWVLDYKALAIPVKKKFEGLVRLEDAVYNHYNPEDNTEALASFDAYRRIVLSLRRNKDSILKQLGLDVQYAEKLGADEATLNELKLDLDKITDLLERKAIPVNSITDLDSYRRAKDALNESKNEGFRLLGIDAKSVYEEAVAKYESGDGNRSEALRLFESIRGYADSVDYIKKINNYFNYYSEFFRFMGKTFIYKLEEKNLFDADSKGKNEEGESEGKKETTYALHEIVGGIPSPNPTVTGIVQIIKCYSTCLYYLKEDKGVCCFDLYSKSETVLDSGKIDDYRCGGDFYIRLNRTSNAFFLKKKLQYVEPKQGCLSSIFGKKAPELRDNNFSVIFCDMKTNQLKTIVPAMVDVADYFEDSLFYTYAEERHLKADEDPESKPLKTCLMVCDLNTGNSSRVLNENCEIHRVEDGKIIYTVWAPNVYNLELRVYNLSNGADVLIEDNVYDYFCTMNGRIYYTVGNSTYCPLMRNNFYGTERLEIMRNVQKVVETRGGWLYVIKGSGSNATLMKVSADGKQRVFVCSQIKHFVKLTESYIYYIDRWNALHRVRTDGRDNRVIASSLYIKPKNIENSIIINLDSIYYLRNELVEENEYSLSLYKMDMSGHNIRKLVFNIDKVMDFDENEIYYSQNEDMRYKVIVPPQKKKDPPEIYHEIYNITKYYRYDKQTETAELVLTLGKPNGKVTINRGCFRKPVDKDIIYEEDPIVRKFKRRGLAKAGAVQEEQIAESVAVPNKSTAQAPKPKKRIKKNNVGKSLLGAFLLLALHFAVSTAGFAVQAIVDVIIAVIAGVTVLKNFLPSTKRSKKKPMFVVIIYAVIIILCLINVIGGVFGGIDFGGNGGNKDDNDSGSAGENFSNASDVYYGVNNAYHSSGEKYYRFAVDYWSGGYYCFESLLADNDFRAELYDSYGSLLASDDDSGEGNNFLLSYYLNGGSTYYLKVYMLSSWKSDNIDPDGWTSIDYDYQISIYTEGSSEGNFNRMKAYATQTYVGGETYVSMNNGDNKYYYVDGNSDSQDVGVKISSYGSMDYVEINVYDSNGSKLDGRTFYSYDYQDNAVYFTINSWGKYYIEIKNPSYSYADFNFTVFEKQEEIEGSSQNNAIEISDYCEIYIEDNIEGRYFTFNSNGSYNHRIYTNSGEYIEVYDEYGNYVSSGSGSVTFYTPGYSRYYVRVYPNTTGYWMQVYHNIEY